MIRFGLNLDQDTFTPDGNEMQVAKVRVESSTTHTHPLKLHTNTQVQYALNRTIEQVMMKRLLEEDDDEKKMETDTKKETKSARRRRRLRERQRVAARDAAQVSLQASSVSIRRANDAMVAVTRLIALKLEEKEREERKKEREEQRKEIDTPSIMKISDEQLDTIADRVARRLENVEQLKHKETNVLRNRIKELEDLTKDLRDKLTVVTRKKKNQIISSTSLVVGKSPSSARTALEVLQNESKKKSSVESSSKTKTQKYSKLHQQIVAFQNATDTMCLRRESAKAEALHRVKNVVRLLWPRALVLLYGSYVSGLSLPSSDIDVVINLPRDSQRGPLDEHNAVRTCVRARSASSVQKSCIIVFSHPKQHRYEQLGSRCWRNVSNKASGFRKWRRRFYSLSQTKKRREQQQQTDTETPWVKLLRLFAS
jgi:hypothetical protein